MTGGPAQAASRSTVTLQVTTLADSGTGSLRNAITLLDADSSITNINITINTLWDVSVAENRAHLPVI